MEEVIGGGGGAAAGQSPAPAASPRGVRPGGAHGCAAGSCGAQGAAAGQVGREKRCGVCAPFAGGVRRRGPAAGPAVRQHRRRRTKFAGAARRAAACGREDAGTRIENLRKMKMREIQKCKNVRYFN